MQIQAHLRYLHMSPRKVRRVAQLISGLTASRADAELFVRKELAAEPLRKLLQSALANARQMSEARAEDIMVRSFIVNPGPVAKRFRPRSRGMAHPYARRMSHVSVVLELPDASRKQSRTAGPLKSDVVTVSPQDRVAEEKPKAQDGKPQRMDRKAAPKLPKLSKRFFQRKSV